MKQSLSALKSRPCRESTDPPIFVVGSARSGTTLLYHMLLSTGSFARFFGEPAVFDLLVPRFGDLSIAKRRERLMDSWIGSKMHRASGLEENSIRARVMDDCKSNADFLRIVMDEVAAHQGVGRWAVWGPDNLLHMHAIKSQMPDVRFIHMIRDGRDVAVSMDRAQFIRPFAWDKGRSLLVAGLHWRWKVRSGRQQAQTVEPDYLEVRFESLINNPRQTLAGVSKFVGCELDYDQIQQDAVGAVKNANSTFKPEGQVLAAHPAGRWKRLLTRDQIARLESCIGDLLQELGYELTTPLDFAADPHRLIKATYPLFFSAKHWLKQHTKAGRFTSTDRMRAA
jgi:Sulfotransferase family